MKFTKYNEGDVIELGYIVHGPTYCFYLKNGVKKYIIEGIKQYKGRTDIVHTKNGEAYCTKKKPHHIIFDNISGASYYYWTDKNGVVDRKDGRPALIEYGNGIIRTKEWFQNGRRNGRDDKAASITYNEHGLLQKEWFQGGVLHRENGPAVIHYDDCGSGQITREEWHLNDVLIRSTDYSAADSMIQSKIQ